MIVVIPLAGEDEVFRDRGFLYAKPLIEIHGKPLIERVWECLIPLKADRYVFVVRQQDVCRTHFDEVLWLMEPKAAVVQAVGPTAGAVVATGRRLRAGSSNSRFTEACFLVEYILASPSGTPTPTASRTGSSQVPATPAASARARAPMMGPRCTT